MGEKANHASGSKSSSAKEPMFFARSKTTGQLISISEVMTGSLGLVCWSCGEPVRPRHTSKRARPHFYHPNGSKSCKNPNQEEVAKSLAEKRPRAEFIAMPAVTTKPKRFEPDDYEVVKNTNGFHVYRMFHQYGKKPGFWIKGKKIVAKVTHIDAYSGRLPTPHPQVLADVYDLSSAQLKDEGIAIKDAHGWGWDWIHPPSWSGEPVFDVRNGRIALNVKFEDNKKAQRLGANWSYVNREWLLDPSNEKAMKKAESLGFLVPVEERILFALPPEFAEQAREHGAKWNRSEKVWSLPASDRTGIQALKNLEAQAAQEETKTKFFFRMPYAKRELAMSLGAKWYPTLKMWFIRSGNELAAVELISRDIEVFTSTVGPTPEQVEHLQIVDINEVMLGEGLALTKRP